MVLKRLALVLLLVAAAFTRFGAAHAVDKVSPDPRGVKLVNALIVALQMPDENARLAAIIPLVHKSLLTNDGKDLMSSVKQFSYRKAVGNAGQYTVPLTITEVHRGNTFTIGFKSTAQSGHTDKYFVAQKSSRPAPVGVFFPADGGEPTIVNFGSL